MTIKQIKVGNDNFSYVIYCLKRRKAAIVDPSYDSSTAIDFILSKNFELDYIINTHYHIDHTSDNKRIKRKFPLSKIIGSKLKKIISKSQVDIYISDREKIKLGDVNLLFLLTPGHTPDGLCIIVNNEYILTGDTLFIGDCGRTDLPGGNIAQMYQTLNEKIKPLPDNIIIYPGHDYCYKPFDTLGNQRTNLLTLIKEFEDYLIKQKTK